MTDKMIYGMGNPLLDILAVVDLDLVHKYQLKENDAILAQEKHMPLYEEIIKNYAVEYVPGGATQNAIKVAQWILKKKYTCVFAGSIKDDQYGKILNDSCEKIGVRTIYQYNEGPESTGVCASLITGHNRSMVTNLGASSKFTVNHLDNQENWKWIQEAKLFYISAFFVTSCPEAVIKVAKHSMENNKQFCFNLGAEFLIEFFFSHVMETIEYTDFLFGNENEALKLAHMLQLNTTDMEKIAIHISNLPLKMQNKKRTVVITQGADSIIVADGELKTFPVTAIKPEKIVDTTGAGDAFVGGFLAQLLHEKPLEECIRCAIWAANVIIQRPGCTFPDECTFV